MNGRCQTIKFQSLRSPNLHQVADISLCPWSHCSRSCYHSRFGLYLLELGSSLELGSRLELGSSLRNWRLLADLRNLRLWDRLRLGWGVVTVKFVVFGFHVKGTSRFQMTSLKMS